MHREAVSAALARVLLTYGLIVAVIVTGSVLIHACASGPAIGSARVIIAGELVDVAGNQVVNQGLECTFRFYLGDERPDVECHPFQLDARPAPPDD